MKNYDIKELIEYKKTHTVKETAKHFETTENYINNLCFKHRGFTRDEAYYKYAYNHTVSEIMKKYDVCELAAKRDKGKANAMFLDQQEVLQYKQTHSVKDCMKKYKISESVLYSILFKNGYKARGTEEPEMLCELKRYATNHTIKEIEKHFDMKKSQVKWLIEKYSIPFKEKAKPVYVSGKTLYILTKDNEELFFTRIIDIAKYFDRTKTQVTMVINNTGKLYGWNVRKARLTYYPSVITEIVK